MADVTNDILVRLENRIRQLEIEKEMYKSKYIKLKKNLGSILKRKKHEEAKLKDMLQNLNSLILDMSVKLDRVDELYETVYLLVSKLDQLENKVRSLERRLNLYEKRHI